jgi:hypothetical protein
MINTSKIVAVLHKIFPVLSFVPVLIIVLSIYIDNEKRKCIDGTVHWLKDNSYWQASGYVCKPLTIEERREIDDTNFKPEG